MLKLFIASSLCLAVNAAVYFDSKAGQPVLGASYGTSEYEGGQGGFEGGYGGGSQGGFGGGYGGGFGGGVQSVAHGLGQSLGYGGGQFKQLASSYQAGYGQGLSGISSGGQGLGHDHHGGVSIVGIGGDQKGITFDLTKNHGIAQRLGYAMAPLKQMGLSYSAGYIPSSSGAQATEVTYQTSGLAASPPNFVQPAPVGGSFYGNEQQTLEV